MPDFVKLVAAFLTGSVGTALMGLVVAGLKERLERRRRLAQDVIASLDEHFLRCSLEIGVRKVTFYPDKQHLLNVDQARENTQRLHVLDHSNAILRSVQTEYGRASVEFQLLREVRLRIRQLSVELWTANPETWPVIEERANAALQELRPLVDRTEDAFAESARKPLSILRPTPGVPLHRGPTPLSTSDPAAPQR